ncbi:hypothetical protein PP655_gp099 [Bacillus phage PBC4]|uniref:Uncharacterized protein n=1 Tax=Bacillus phage PBC4 TaxID=1675028 RepID=A0A1D6X8E3_9CAUD|nr:hypothetical protein PP655_gp099 [Bacillus phage PBC4]AKQ08291.1 hypothetical protein PBC4_099 [Bacillus phage PBC4]
METNVGIHNEDLCNECFKKQRENILSRFSTKELSEELKKREGVHAVYVNPHELRKINIEGSAVVLINRD